MQLFKCLTQLISINIAFCFAHSDYTQDTNKVAPVAKYSLPDLIQLKSIPSNFKSSEQAGLNEGRIVLTPKENSKGSLWLKDDVPISGSFTIEWTFRSVNYVGKSVGGLAFWFITSGAKDDKALYNGPSTYNGLQLVVDDNTPIGQSIRGLLNDGSEKLTKEAIYEKTFASCLMGYQDASVPLTARLTYDINDNLLKLQIDNKVCFQTRKIKLPVGMDAGNGYSIGASAENDKTSESFEILQMKYYDSVLEDALIPNALAMAQPKLITKIIDKDTGSEKLVDKEVLDSQNSKLTNFELYKKIDKLEGKILANDISSLSEKLDAIIKIQDGLINQMTHLAKRLENPDAAAQATAEGLPADVGQFKDFISVNEKLEKMLKEQEKIRESTKLANQQQLLHNNGPQIDEIVRKLTIWLIPLILIMLIMAYYTFMIRQEISKTKLL